MDWIPEYPVERQIIKTYADGRFGVHEYSVWPQAHVESMMHVACIPLPDATPALPSILWTALEEERDWAADPDVAVEGLGFIVRGVRSSLAQVANYVIAEFHRVPQPPHQVGRYARFLVLVLRQCVDRLSALATVGSRAIAVAAHVQRLCLELWGMKTYLEVVVPRMESDRDYSRLRLQVLGAFLREGADVQTWWRVGMPVWVVQPLRRDMEVWELVEPRSAGRLTSTDECNPPILHTAGAFIGVTNLTGNWLSSMVMSVSKHVAGSHVSGLSLAVAPGLAAEGLGVKRRKLDDGMKVAHLEMRPAVVAPEGAEGGMTRGRNPARRGKGGKGASADNTPSAPPAAIENSPVDGIADAGSLAAPDGHPARTFMPSSLLDMPEAWNAALRRASPVAHSNNASLYFYPCPFLLDCVGEGDPMPPWLPHPQHARVDTKVNRYLHNLVRIRLFCRSRLFDATLSNNPLSIAEWRTALWGDYQPKTHAPRAHAKKATVLRRELRRQSDRNRTIHMFRKVARMDSYDANVPAMLGDVSVDLDGIVTNASVRRRLVWEAYELNFRAEVMALDRLLVQGDNWEEIYRWEREGLVAKVWGEASGVSVIPHVGADAPQHFWFRPPDTRWQGCVASLGAFVKVMVQWPDAPDTFVQGCKPGISPSSFAELQAEAVDFYVKTFVRTFMRLPTPPMRVLGSW